MALRPVTIPDRSHPSMETFYANASFYQSLQLLSWVRFGVLWHPNQILNYGQNGEKNHKTPATKGQNTTRGEETMPSQLPPQGSWVYFSYSVFLWTLLRKQQSAQLLGQELASCPAPEALNPQSPAALWSSLSLPPERATSQTVSLSIHSTRAPCQGESFQL